jgi:hypothetical protein
VSPVSIKWRWLGAALIGLELAFGAFVISIPISQVAQTRSIIDDVESVRLVSVSDSEGPENPEGFERWVTVQGNVRGRGPNHSLFVVPDAVFCPTKFYRVDNRCIDSVGRSGWAGVFDFTLKLSSTGEFLIVFAPGCAPQEMNLYALLWNSHGDHVLLAKNVTLDCRLSAPFSVTPGTSEIPGALFW